MWYRAQIARLPMTIPRISSRSGRFATTNTWSIRRITAKTNREIPDNQLVTLINYDVSNVDNLYLPLAMEANDVWVVPRNRGPEGAEPVCWDGVAARYLGLDRSHQLERGLQSHIHEFTADDNQLLGQYFGGKRWLALL